MSNVENKMGSLIIISGFAGSGKGTVMKKLLELYPEDYALSISATTRSPRTGEEDGREYFFKTKQEFEKMIEEDKFLEHACYVDNYYGTPSEYVMKKRSEGKNVILEIEIQGALQIKKRFSDTILMFITPPSCDELIARIKGRGTESDEVIVKRMERAIEESKLVEDNYDYLVINDEVDKCANKINNIVLSEHYKAKNSKSFLGIFRKDLCEFTKGE